MRDESGKKGGALRDGLVQADVAGLELTGEQAPHQLGHEGSQVRIATPVDLATLLLHSAAAILMPALRLGSGPCLAASHVVAR